MTHHEPICPSCYIEDIALQRYALGYRTCLTCGEKQAKKVKHCVAPLNPVSPPLCE